MKALDPVLIDILDDIKPKIFTGILWRTTFSGKNPLMGGHGNARWSAAKGNETLYTSYDRDTSLREIQHHLSQLPIFPSADIQICELLANNLQVIDLTQPGVLESMGIEQLMPQKDYYKRGQEIGSVARFLEYTSIRVPSIRANGDNCVIYMEHIDIDVNETLTVNECNKIDLRSYH